MKLSFPIIALLCLLTFSLQAQQLRSKEQLLKGRVVLATDTSQGIAFVQVYNKTSGKGNTSDGGGFFRLLAAPGDSLEFRMIGYTDTTLSYSQLKKLNHIVPLSERVYKLRQVDVRANRLKKSFAPEETPDDPYLGYRSVKPSGRPAQKQGVGLGSGMNGGTAIVGGITALANKFNKKEKQRERIRQLKEQDRVRKYYKALFDYWFDEEIVQEITGLEGAELKRFLKFCSPSLTFLERTTEYEAIRAIQEYYRKYQNINRY